MLVGFNRKTFAHPYLSVLYREKQKINPRFLFVPTVYELDSSVAARPLAKRNAYGESEALAGKRGEADGSARSATGLRDFPHSIRLFDRPRSAA
jgi:hypothetical protein